MRVVLQSLFIKIFGRREGELMMAMFFAQRVILDKTKFDAVPQALKPQVAEILIESGLEELVPPEFKT